MHQSQKSTALTLAVEMSALMGGIQFVFLSVLLLLEMCKKPAKRVWANAKRKCCGKKDNMDDGEEGPDVEGGAVNNEDVSLGTDEDNDEVQPLLPAVAGGEGSDVAGRRTTTSFAALEAIVSDLIRDNEARHRDHDVLHTKVRGNSATLRALFQGGSAKPAVEDSIDASWSLDKIIVTCDSDDNADDELRRFVVGTFALVLSHARHPTWQRTVGDDVIQIYHRRRHWHIGVQGGQALARSVIKAGDVSLIEVDWEVCSANDGAAEATAPAGVWRTCNALSLNVPASTDFMSRLKGIFSRATSPPRAAPVPAVEMVRAPRRVERPAPEGRRAAPTGREAEAAGDVVDIVPEAAVHMDNPMQQPQALGAAADRRAGGGGGPAAKVEVAPVREDAAAAIVNTMRVPAAAVAAAEANDPSEAAVVPRGWVANYSTAHDMPFYTNVHTGEKVWEKPTLPAPPAGWSVHAHGDGGEHYFQHNAGGGATQWHHPHGPEDAATVRDV